MSGQLAKLFIRGSLVNVTAKNLTEEQQEAVMNLMNLVWEDRAIDTAKYKFCNVLSCTIGNEYKNKDFAMNEIWITIWRTAVDILYHHPRPNVVENIHARRKYFKQCIYMYMKQILNENKIPSYRNERTMNGEAHHVASEIIQFYFDNALKKPVAYTIEESNTGIKFMVDMDTVPSATMEKIEKLKNEVRDLGALLIITDESIAIVPESEVKNFKKKVSEKARVSFYSMSGFNHEEEKNNFQQHCEYKAIKKREVELDSMLVQDSVEALLARLPETARQVCEILVNTPKDFLDEYYPRRKKPVRPRATHIAKYLGISKNEVTKAMDLIEKQATALDIG
jgi:hypothetical protein